MTQVTTSSGRYYEFGGEKFPSVTTILSKAIAKPGLVPWASKLVAEGAINHFEHWTGMSDAEAITYLAGLPDRRRNSSANLGSTIHAAAEAYSKGEALVKPVSPEAQKYLVGFNQFLSDWNPTFILTEQAVFNRTHRYAGTLDALVRIGRTIWVLDTKTGNRVYPEVALQLAAYANAEFIGRNGGIEEPMPPVKKGGVIHLTPKGYNFIESRIDEEVFETFLSAKDMFQWSWGLSGAVLRGKKVK